MKSLFAIILLALAATVQAQGAPERAKRPNVIVILADDLGFSDLGCYGGEIQTPNLDRLAQGGVRFSAFYTSARCCPSRASLMTGLHPHQAGVGSFATAEPEAGFGPAYVGHLLPTCVTLAEILGDAGYSTWMVGKWHMGVPGPIDRGFQNYFGFRDFLAHSEDQWTPDKYVRLPADREPEHEIQPGAFYATDVFTEYALEFLNQARAQDRPYFLYLAESAPHFPLQAPREDVDRHMATYRRGWDVLRAERFARQKALGLFPADAALPPRSMVPVDRDDVANGFPGQPNPAWDSLPEDRREDLARRMATFAAMVEHVDAGVGRILEDLRKHDDLDDTLIFFLSDNGACYEWGPFGFDGRSRDGRTTLHVGAELERMGQPGTHHAYGSGWANLCNTPLNMYKHFCHEGGIADPLIVHWPDRIKAAGAWRSDPSHLMDVVPTVLEAAGAAYPKTRDERAVTPVEGVSLLPAIDGELLPERALPFEHQDARGLRRGRWKITWGKRQPAEPTWELYDLRNDRSERRNLAAEKPDLVKELAGEWESWARRVGCKPFAKPDASADGASRSPRIDGRPLKIAATVRADAPHGVVVAQGGRQHGYALHFIQGRPAFDVRIDGRVTRLIAPDAVRGDVALSASLDVEKMSLSVNGGEPLVGPSPGLIPVQPLDAMDVGFDSRTAAGDYEPPNPFNGEIIQTRVAPAEPKGDARRGR